IRKVYLTNSPPKFSITMQRMSDAAGTISSVRVAVVPGPGQSGLLRRLREDGSPDGDVAAVPDLAAAIGEYEQKAAPRWVWPSTAGPYQRLLRGGVRVARCHDVALADALILGRDAALGADREANREDGLSPGARADAARALLQAPSAADAAEAAREAGQQGLFDVTDG